MSVEERDVWRSPDGRYRLVAVVCDGKKGLTTYYTARTLRGGFGQMTTPYEAISGSPVKVRRNRRAKTKNLRRLAA